MSQERSPEGIQQVWQGQEKEGVRMSVEQLRASAGKFQRRIQWRNAREYTAGLAVMLFFGGEFVRAAGAPLVRVGFALTIVGMAYVLWHLLTKGGTARLPEAAGRTSYLEFQRAELVRQRDLLRGVWRWYLGPLVPGMATLVTAFALANPRHVKNFAALVALEAVFMAGVLFAIGWLNARAAQRLQRQIDELDQERGTE